MSPVAAVLAPKVRGGVADGTEATSVLGVAPRDTDDVITQLYQWGDVARVATSVPGGSR